MGIVSIEKEEYSGYVYNLSIEGDEMYFANDLLVHNCSCRFVRVFDKRYEEISKKEARKPITSRTLVTTNIGSMILPKIIGTTLLVGGAFMLARSNVWKKVFSVAMDVKLPPLTKAEAVLDAVDYIDDVIGGPAADITSDVLKDGVQRATTQASRVP